MKQCDEVSEFTSECDDYKAEAAEVLKDQGRAIVYSYGVYLVASIVAACDATLDNLDEGSPLPAAVLSELTGTQLTPQEYHYYFSHFLIAQQQQAHARLRGDAVEKVKNEYAAKWQQHYQAFCTAPTAESIPVVQQYRKALHDASSSSCVIQ